MLHIYALTLGYIISYYNCVREYNNGRYMKSKRDKLLPLPVKRALVKLGEDIRNARRRRRIQTQVMAERASITRSTLHKVERGDPGVSLGIYATVLFSLGMLDRLSQIADAAYDRTGMDLADESLPQRIRHRKPGHHTPETAP